jgi:glycosidase
MDANFKTVSWAATSTIYEVNIRQYTSEGTFVAFQKHLPRLQSMGVDILWLMPITPISQFKRKGSLGSYYACSSYTKINPEMGNENDFSNLVKAAHSLGM